MEPGLMGQWDWGGEKRRARLLDKYPSTPCTGGSCGRCSFNLDGKFELICFGFYFFLFFLIFFFFSFSYIDQNSRILCGRLSVFCFDASCFSLWTYLWVAIWFWIVLCLLFGSCFDLFVRRVCFTRFLVAFCLGGIICYFVHTTRETKRRLYYETELYWVCGG